MNDKVKSYLSDAIQIDHPILNKDETFSHVEADKYHKKEKVLFKDNSILLPIRLFSSYDSKDSLVAIQRIHQDGSISYVPEDYQNTEGCNLIGGIRKSKENYKWIVKDYFFACFLRNLLDSIYHNNDIVVLCYNEESIKTILNKYVSDYKKVITVIRRYPYFCHDCSYFWTDLSLDKYLHNQQSLQSNLKCQSCKSSNTMVPESLSIFSSLKKEITKWVTPNIMLYGFECVSDEVAKKEFQSFIIQHKIK